MDPERRLVELGWTLPEPFQAPGAARYPFSWVRRRGDRAYVSGHLPLAADGSLKPPLPSVSAGTPVAWLVL